MRVLLLPSHSFWPVVLAQGAQGARHFCSLIVMEVLSDSIINYEFAVDFGGAGDLLFIPGL